MKVDRRASLTASYEVPRKRAGILVSAVEAEGGYFNTKILEQRVL